jgi:NADPH oxidase
MVPSANCLLYSCFYRYPYSCSLRQVSYPSCTANTSLLIYASFYNVEKNQIRPERAIEIHFAQAGGITGHVMLLCMMLMYTTAHHRIRQQAYETFWYAHHLFIPFMLALYTHATGCFVRDTTDPFSPFAGEQFWDHCLGYEGWRWEIVVGALYLFERVYREIRARRETVITKVIRHPYGMSFPMQQSII